MICTPAKRRHVYVGYSDEIDWQASEIRLTQEKTNIPLAFLLDATTGNAIAEYILHVIRSISLYGCSVPIQNCVAFGA